MLEINLFGPGQAHYSNRPLLGFPSQQCYLLLCYLLLNRSRSHHRERLAALFWGEYPTDISRKHLRNTLWKLRHELQAVSVPVEEYLQIGDDSITFLTSGRYCLDVEVFETAVTRYQDLSGRDLPPEQAAELAKAVEIYTGDLLEGVYADWCLYDREQLRLLHLNTLGKLAAFHELNGTYERGLAYAERILKCDKTRERVHRQIMRFYWYLNDRGAALAQYKRCAQILNEELGIPPSQETKLLYEQMLHNRFDPAIHSGHNEDNSVTILDSNGPQPLAEHALQKLHRLQGVIQETSVELQHIEHLINVALLQSKGLIHR